MAATATQKKAGHLRQQVPAVVPPDEGENVTTVQQDTNTHEPSWEPLARLPLDHDDKTGPTANIYGWCAWFCYTVQDGEPASRGLTVEEHSGPWCHYPIGPVAHGAVRDTGEPAEVGLELAQAYMHGTYRVPLTGRDRAQYVRLTIGCLNDDEQDRDSVYLPLADARDLYVALGQAIDALDDQYRVVRKEEHR